MLEGLAKFAHLINVDFFEDLMGVLKKIAIEQQAVVLSANVDTKAGRNKNNSKKNGFSDIIVSLHCVVASLELMESIGGALKIDLTDFYTLLYTMIICMKSTRA